MQQADSVWMIMSKIAPHGYNPKKKTCLQRSAFQSSSFTATQRAPSPVTLCVGKLSANTYSSNSLATSISLGWDSSHLISYRHASGLRRARLVGSPAATGEPATSREWFVLPEDRVNSPEKVPPSPRGH